MKDQTMSRFRASSSDPADRSGVAAYSFHGKTFEHPMPSFERARELEQFIAHVIRQTRSQAMAAAVAQLRGTANTLEADA